MIIRGLEVPPTAGLPAHWRDALPPWNADLGATAATYVDVDFPLLPVASGTAGLLIALRTLADLDERRKVVIIPAYTCPQVALAVHQAGLEIRLCDVVAGGFDLDTEQFEKLCDQDILAVLPTHLAGRVADVARIHMIAKGCGAFIIEDAAQALGARSYGQSVGLVGDIGLFSLGVGKGLSTYAGGLLLARDPYLRRALAATARTMLRSHPGREAWRILEWLGYFALYRPRGLVHVYGRPLRRALRHGDLLGAVGDDLPSRIPLQHMGRFRASVGTRAFARLAAFHASTEIQAQNRVARLQAIEGVQVLRDAAGGRGVWPVLMLRLPSEAMRDAVLRQLWGERLGVTRMFIHALPDYPALRSLLLSAHVPNGRALAATTLTVSNSLWLDEAGFTRVLQVIAKQLSSAEGCDEN